MLFSDAFNERHCIQAVVAQELYDATGGEDLGWTDLWPKKARDCPYISGLMLSSLVQRIIMILSIMKLQIA